MSIERARAHLDKYGFAERIREFTVSSATVALAAAALGVMEARIAQTLSFALDDGVILVVTAGDAKVSNSKFKATFHKKAKMLAFEEVEMLIGHGVGGVCPFGINDGVRVYLDLSLKRFDTVFPAAGTASSAVELSIPELELASEAAGWVDVTSLPEEQ